MRAGHADELSALFERRVEIARAPSSCVSSPRMTSGAPSGLLQRMPETMNTPVAHAGGVFGELVEIRGAR